MSEEVLSNEEAVKDDNVKSDIKKEKFKENEEFFLDINDHDMVKRNDTNWRKFQSGTNEIENNNAKDCIPSNNAPVPGALQSTSFMPINTSSSGGSLELSSSPSLNQSPNVNKSNQQGASHHPLASNCSTLPSSTKASMSVESQYMQQSNAIYVFTTQLANQAAESVSNHQYPSLVAFAKAQPGTREILEKNPLKVQQTSRNSSQWLNNFAQMKSNVKGMKGMNMNQINSGMSPLSNAQCGSAPTGFRPGLNNNGPCVRPCNSNSGPRGPTGPGTGINVGLNSDPNCNWGINNEMCSNISWKSQASQSQKPSTPQQQNSQRSSFPQSPGMSLNMRHQNSSLVPRPCSVNNGSIMSPMSSSNQMNFPSNPKVTKGGEENLTPQQSQLREEKLAKLAELQLTLFGDQQNNMQGMNISQSNTTNRLQGSSMPSPLDGCPPRMVDSSMFSPNSCLIPENNHSSSDPSANQIMNPSSVMNNSFSGESCHNHSLPTTPGGSSQQDWQKMQHQYMDDNRRRKCPTQGSIGSLPSPLSQSSSTLNSPNPNIIPNPGNKIPVPPPPPYHQGHRPLSSPHPSSITTNSSLSLQSPGDSSRQQYSSGGSMRLPPYASPGPATPSGENNSSLSMIPAINSPKPGPPSSSLTPTSGGSNGSMISRTPTSGAPSTQTNTSPTVKKMKLQSSENNDINSSSNPSGLLNDCKSMHGIGNCPSPDLCKSEPQLMPVPSPQQIQYLNAFEGQELTIQRQPNTSLRDNDLISPPDLDTNFSNEYSSSQFPITSMENGPRFMSSDNNLNSRFSASPGNCGPSSYDLPNPRFMQPDQRFNNPAFEGNRLPGPLDGPPNHHIRSQNMPVNCGPYSGAPRMERFSTPGDNYMGNRMRMPMNEVGMQRYNTPMNENMQSQFNQMQMMHPMMSKPYNGPPHLMDMNSGGDGVSSPHLQNLQKMTPPFDIGPPGSVKMDNIMNSMMNNTQQMMPGHSNGPNTGSSGPSGSGGSGHGMHGPLQGPSISQSMQQFDPIASMAAMSETTNQMSPNLISSTMNMSNMQVAASNNSGQPGQMVNFHTSMSSMHNVHQNLGPTASDGSNINGGVPNQYNMNQPLGPNMMGGPQTVNNTYVNANMSIQQLNIQNGPSPNYNPNMPMQGGMQTPPSGMNMPGVPGHLPAPHNQINGPSGSMQMMPHGSPSPKLGMNTPPGSSMNVRMMSGSGPPHCPPFHGQAMQGSQRGMSPMNYPVNHNMPSGTSCGVQRMPYSSGPNIQVKPSAPNTIQYLPTRPNNANQSPTSRPPNLDFLPRYAAPISNLESKVPTPNFQYFPNNGGNINSNQPMPPQNSNLSLSLGPGRPGSMMRPSGQMIPPVNNSVGPNMMSDMFNRPPNSNQPGGSGVGGTGHPPGPPPPPPSGPISNVGPVSGSGPSNPIYSGMKPGNRGLDTVSPLGIPPDASQPLPPSMGHSYNYKQGSFYAPMSNDPNYPVQFHNFQQQLYATNTRGNTSGSGNNQLPPNCNM